LRRPALTLAALALALAGCGGGDEPRRTATVPAGASLHVVAKEYSFDPDGIVVRGGGSLRVTLDNEGSLAHNLKLRKDGRVVGGTPAFPAGESRTANLHVARGRYEYLCTVGDHAELGMKGTLEVR
jgi:plastocyanin